MPAPLELSRLRDIGRSFWDPIGLFEPGAAWDGQPFADEYDRDLLRAADGLRLGWTARHAADYLVRIERDDMGIGEAPSARPRAEATAGAILAYVRSLSAAG